MVLVALTKVEIRQRRWVKQRISYLESDNARIVKLLSDRISSLEELLIIPTRVPAYSDGVVGVQEPSPDTERSEVVSCSICVLHPQQRSESWDAFMRRHREHLGEAADRIYSGVE